MRHYAVRSLLCALLLTAPFQDYEAKAQGSWVEQCARSFSRRELRDVEESLREGSRILSDSEMHELVREIQNPRVAERDRNRMLAILYAGFDRLIFLIAIRTEKREQFSSVLSSRAQRLELRTLARSQLYLDFPQIVQRFDFSKETLFRTFITGQFRFYIADIYEQLINLSDLKIDRRNGRILNAVAQIENRAALEGRTVTRHEIETEIRARFPRQRREIDEGRLQELRRYRSLRSLNLHVREAESRIWVPEINRAYTIEPDFGEGDSGVSVFRARVIEPLLLDIELRLEELRSRGRSLSTNEGHERVKLERFLVILDERLLSEEPATRDEIGERLGVSRTRAHQLESLIIEEIKERLHASGLYDELSE